MVTQTKALRGKERVQQLMEEFPEIPRTLVLKADLLREGIRHSETTRQLGRWAMPYAPWYFEYSRESIHSQGDKTGGYFKEPLMGHFGDGVAWPFLWLSTSPYDVRYEGAGRYRLYRDDVPIEEAFFPVRPQWYDLKTSSGKLMCTIMQQRGENGAMLVPLHYCEYFKDGNGCCYCNMNPTESARSEQGLERALAKRDREVYETAVAVLKEGCVSPPGKVTLSGGAMVDSGKEAANYARLARVLKQAMKDVECEAFDLNAAMAAVEPEDHMMLKEAGVTRVCHALEVWDPRLFQVICPGKAKNVGRERWLERLVSAVPIYDKGKVNSSFVVGVELAHPEGFKSEDEAFESNFEGFKWMLEHGTWAAALLFRPVPGTMFENMAPPRTEYFLRVDLARHKLAVEHNRVLMFGTQPSKSPFPGLGSSDYICLSSGHAPASDPTDNVCCA